MREADPLWSLAAQGDLPDINVWLALAVQEHPHHEAAQAYWADFTATRPGARLWFCRITMLGLLRLVCQPKAVGPGALSSSAAWKLYQRFRAVPAVGLLTEPTGCEAHIEALCSNGALPARLWTDAYLAAMAQAGGLRLVTFDRDFQRFALPACLILKSTER